MVTCLKKIVCFLLASMHTSLALHVVQNNATTTAAFAQLIRNYIVALLPSLSVIVTQPPTVVYANWKLNWNILSRK